ncbi:hypothetical protein COL5a_010843 [Colletotrichum fioriniae]|nr:hypothetical protein COL5a_010843 [Colletotrichum fioriniae]
MQASAKCEFRESDFKRPPVSREYVAALESRIASLESLLGNLKAADGDERNQILDDLEVQDYVPSFSGLPLADEIALSEAMTKASFQEMTDGSMIYHGPTSIFQNEVSPSIYPTSSSTASKPSAFHEDKANLTNQTMRLCIGLFFFWQYPLFMFIDREAFVQEFEDNPVDGNFCSPPLIYACAALGALMSKDPEIRPRAQEFADTAQTILTTDELGVSRPTSVQAWLCLAYFEVGLSNMSKSWLYTVHDMLSQTFAPKKMKDPAARRWNEVSLNKLNARLVAWHEALPTNMRWKKWFTNKDILQPNVSILHMFYHSTRICLNLPFLASVRHIPSTAELVDNDDDTPETASNNPIIKSLRICQSSAQGIADVLQRFKSQHTLGNAPLIFVGATIVATNAVLVTTRRQRGGGGVPQLMKDTLLPVLDGALEDMSASYKLAEEARAKVRIALKTKEQHRHDAGGQKPEIVPVGVDGESACGTEPVAVVVDPALSGPVDPPVTTAAGPGSATVTTEVPGFMSPEQQGSELEYLDGVTEFDWTDRPPIP